MPLGLKALISNSHRSKHVVIIVALAVMVVYSSFSLSGGYLRRVEGVIEGYSLTNMLFLSEGGEAVSSSRIDESIISSFPDSTASLPLIIVEASLILPDREEAIDVWGVEIGDFMDVRRVRLRGQPFKESFEALAGISLAQQYGIEVGHLLNIEYESRMTELLVTGIYESSSPYDQGIIISVQDARTLRPEMVTSISLIELKVNELDNFKSIREDLGYRFPDLDIHPGIALYEYVQLFASDVFQNLLIVSVVIAFISQASIYYSMNRIVVESRYELRVLRYLGYNRLQMGLLVIVVSILLCLFGGLIGLLIGVLASYVASMAIYVVLKQSFLVPVFQASHAEFILVMTIILGLIGGLVPAIRGSKIEDLTGAGQIL